MRAEESAPEGSASPGRDWPWQAWRRALPRAPVTGVSGARRVPPPHLSFPPAHVSVAAVPAAILVRTDSPLRAAFITLALVPALRQGLVWLPRAVPCRGRRRERDTDKNKKQHSVTGCLRQRPYK